MRVVGSGALNIDFFYEVEDLSELAPYIKGLRPGGEVWGTRAELEQLRQELERRGRLLATSGGGSAANTIYALNLWGFETGFIGLVGEDDEGEQILQELEGVDLSRVIRCGQTACCLIILDQTRDRAIFVAPHSQEEILAGLEIETEDREWLHLSSLVSQEGFSFHLRLKSAHPGPFSLDPGEIYAARGLRVLSPLLEGAEVVFLTEEEAHSLGLSETKKRLAKRMVIKKGARGAELRGPEGCFQQEAVSPGEIIDNTGAGDVFDAGFLAGLFLGLGEQKALKLAAHLAALSLKNFGRLGFPRAEEFKNLFEGVRHDSCRT